MLPFLIPLITAAASKASEGQGQDGGSAQASPAAAPGGDSKIPAPQQTEQKPAGGDSSGISSGISNLFGGIKSMGGGNALGSVGKLFSDEKLKENVSPAPEMIDSILRKLKPGPGKSQETSKATLDIIMELGQRIKALEEKLGKEKQ